MGDAAARRVETGRRPHAPRERLRRPARAFAAASAQNRTAPSGAALIEETKVVNMRVETAYRVIDAVLGEGLKPKESA